MNRIKTMVESGKQIAEFEKEVKYLKGKINLMEFRLGSLLTDLEDITESGDEIQIKIIERLEAILKQ